VTGFFPEPTVGDDLVFRELMVTVWNRMLLRLSDGSVTEREAEEIGFMLRRVWFVAQAYKARRKDRSFEEWLKELKDTARGAGLAFP